MATTPITIRDAVRPDLPGLVDLYQHLSEGDAVPDFATAVGIFEQFHSYPGSAIIVGEVDGILVASCTLVVIPNLTRGGTPYGLLENVVTHRDFRNRGFGSELLRHAASAAWAAGCYKLMLMTGSKKPETLNFYITAGFEQSKTGFQMRQISKRADS